jgi:hypothetical protein
MGRAGAIAAAVMLSAGIASCSSSDGTGCDDGGSCSSVTAGASSAPQSTEAVTLSLSLGCRTAEVWGVSPDRTIGVGVVTRDSQPSSAQATEIDFDTTSDEVEFIAYRGTDVTSQLCGASGTPTATRLEIVSGSGTLALDALGPIPMGGRLTTTELVLDDGTVIAPMDVTATCIGCFPS